MPYLPDNVPAPQLDETNEPFWQNCNKRKLSFQQCVDCRHITHPPLPVCPACQSLRREWIEAPPEAVVFSYTWAHTAAHPSVKSALPYNVTVVEFPELPGVRLITNVIDVKPGELDFGDRVELDWEMVEGPQWVPRFRKR